MGLIRGSRIAVRTIRAMGGKYLFGTSGTTFTEVLEDLAGTGLEFILCLHESAAVAMADGHARATGRPALVLVHDTAGTANIMGGLGTALSDRTPLVILSAQRDTAVPSIHTPHETYELIEMTRPFTKWSWQVPEAARLEEALVRAFTVAVSPPSGPVFLGIPQKVFQGRAEKGNHRSCVELPSGGGDPDLLVRAAALLRQARSPALIAGNGAHRAGAAPELEELAELIAAPVVLEPFVSFAPFPTRSLYFYGGYLKNPRPVQRADVLLGAGCRLFLDKGHTPIPPIPARTRIIHLQEDPWEIGRACTPEVGILGGVQSSLRGIIRHIRQGMTAGLRREIGKRAERIRGEKARMTAARLRALGNERRSPTAIRPARFFHELGLRMGAGAVIVDEAVTLSPRLMEYLPLEPGSYFARSGLYLGWGLPAAVGIQMALPEKEVIACLGDGSLIFGVQALWTAARQKVPVKAIVLNNRGYQAIRTKLAGRERLAAADLVKPEIDIAGLAACFGLPGRRISAGREIGPALEELLARKGPALLEVVVAPDSGS